MKIPIVQKPDPNAFSKDKAVSVDKLIFNGWEPTLHNIKSKNHVNKKTRQ
jgi:hypothetical protein